MVCKIVVQFHSFTCDHTIFLARLIEEVLLSLVCILGLSAVDELTICAWIYFQISVMFYWSIPGIEPRSPALLAAALTSEPLGKPRKP